MIEIIVLEHLAQELGYPVYTEEPTGPVKPAKYVLIRKAENGPENHILHAMILVQSYGNTMLDASYLNELAKAAMERMADRDDICRVQLNSDYNFTDTASKRYRYQAVFDVYYYD